MDEIIANKLAQAIGERNELADAIRQTLTENAHLTDGEICTLKRLKDVLLKVDESIQENKKVETRIIRVRSCRDCPYLVKERLISDHCSATFGAPHIDNLDAIHPCCKLDLIPENLKG